MPDTICNIWYYVEGHNTLFRIITSSTKVTSELKDKIKEEGKNGVLNNVDASSLTLWKERYF